MTDIYTNFNDKSVAVDTGKSSLSGFQAKSMQRQFEWEKAYLESQQKNVEKFNAGNNNHNENFNTNNVLNEVSVPVRSVSLINIQQHNNQRIMPSIASMESIEGVTADIKVNKQQLMTNVKNNAGIELVDSSLANKIINKYSDINKSNQMFSLSKNYEQVKYTTEDNTLLISRDNNNVKLWLRNTDVNTTSNYKLVDSLRSIFNRLGLKVTEITLNGDKLWSLQQDNISSGYDSTGLSQERINQIY